MQSIDHSSGSNDSIWPFFLWKPGRNLPVFSCDGKVWAGKSVSVPEARTRIARHKSEVEQSEDGWDQKALCKSD
jgi:hypothetical protein